MSVKRRNKVTQSFDEWFKKRHSKTGIYEEALSGDDNAIYLRHEMRKAFQVGAQSRKTEIDKLEMEIKETQAFLNNQNHIKQTKIDELQKRVDVYEKHITVIKNIHENEFNEDSDTSWILGNLDGFFECLNEDLKGK